MNTLLGNNRPIHAGRGPPGSYVNDISSRKRGRGPMGDVGSNANGTPTTTAVVPSVPNGTARRFLDNATAKVFRTNRGANVGQDNQAAVTEWENPITTMILLNGSSYGNQHMTGELIFTSLSTEANACLSSYSPYGFNMFLRGVHNLWARDMLKRVTGNLDQRGKKRGDDKQDEVIIFTTPGELRKHIAYAGVVAGTNDAQPYRDVNTPPDRKVHRTTVVVAGRTSSVTRVFGSTRPGDKLIFMVLKRSAWKPGAKIGSIEESVPMQLVPAVMRTQRHPMAQSNSRPIEQWLEESNFAPTRCISTSRLGREPACFISHTEVYENGLHFSGMSCNDFVEDDTDLAYYDVVVTEVQMNGETLYIFEPDFMVGEVFHVGVTKFGGPLAGSNRKIKDALYSQTDHAYWSLMREPSLDIIAQA